MDGEKLLYFPLTLIPHNRKWSHLQTFISRFVIEQTVLKLAAKSFEKTSWTLAIEMYPSVAYQI